jgi:tetratricopeptide (TPR) repeat protein
METIQRTGRYRFVRLLGRGAVGEVHLVHDHARGRDVALKRLRNPAPDVLLRFKREFRAIEQLSHENLVRLYELGEDEDGWYLAMEAIQGVDLRQRCAASDPSREVLAALPQIAAALGYLHARGIVHRDIKPSNVLVRDDGIAKVLDFGIAAELRAGALRQEWGVAGTPGYMAPEQIRGEEPAPGWDSYAVGAMVFELVAGRPVFGGDRDTRLLAHLEEPPPRLCEVAPHAPEILERVTRALLCKRANERATLVEVARMLGSVGRPVPEVVASVIDRPDALLGRGPLQNLLSARLHARDAPLVVLAGPSGVGKSALLEWIAREAERAGLRVLHGAARPSERVPFNALDGVVDDVARALASLSPPLPEEIADAARVLSAVFPVLGERVGPSLEAARERVRARLFGAKPKLGTRPSGEVFGALATLVAYLDARVGVMVAIDDFQWADDDSIVLFTRCLDALPRSIPVVVAVRDDVEVGTAVKWLENRPGSCRVEVPALDETHILAIIRRTAMGTGSELAETVLRAAVPACAGRPFLAEVAGRALATQLAGHDALAALVAHAMAYAQTILAFVAAADDRLPLSTVASLADMPLGVVEDDVRRLEVEGLLRRAGGAGLDGAVDFYHHGIRSAVLDALERPTLEGAHARIADDLAARGAAAHRVVRHLVGADRSVEAAVVARRAARGAEAQRAFDLAAEMYAVALRHPDGDETALRTARARALERVGRYEDAASVWSVLASTGSGRSASDAMLNEAHALLAANRAPEGLRRLDEVLARSGEATSRLGRVASVVATVRFATGAFVLPSASRGAPDPAVAARAERNVKIGALLSFLEPMTGIRFLQQARAGFDRTETQEQAASCDYIFAVLALIGTRKRRGVLLADSYRRLAESRLEGRVPRPELRGKPLFLDGLAALRLGRWDDARARFAEAAAVFADSDGTTELMMARSWSAMADVYMQRIDELERHVASFRHGVRLSGDMVLRSHVEVYAGYAHFLSGRYEAARATIDRRLTMFGADRPNTQRGAALLYRHLADIYLDDGRHARRSFASALSATKQYRYFDSMFAGPFAGIGAIIEANALRVRARDASGRRVLSLCAIMDDAPPLVAGTSWRARAYVADAMGRPEQAISYLEKAEREAERFGRCIDPLIARYQRGRRLGGDEGAALCADARERVIAAGSHPSILEEDAGLR